MDTFSLLKILYDFLFCPCASNVAIKFYSHATLRRYATSMTFVHRSGNRLSNTDVKGPSYTTNRKPHKCKMDEFTSTLCFVLTDKFVRQFRHRVVS